MSSEQTLVGDPGRRVPVHGQPGHVCTTLPAPEENSGLARKLNWLRAGVMGANDGIVSTAGIVVGVAGASVSYEALRASGVAGVVAGALSMAVGEYVSVSSQRDSERAVLKRQATDIDENPKAQMHHLAALVAQQGVDAELACQVSEQLSRGDALGAHARYKHRIDPDELTNPWHAGLASMLAFVLGSLIPLVAILASPRSYAVPVTAAAVLIALAMTGVGSAYFGGASRFRAAARTIGGGALAMTVTYAIGSLMGTQI